MNVLHLLRRRLRLKALLGRLLLHVDRHVELSQGGRIFIIRRGHTLERKQLPVVHYDVLGLLACLPDDRVRLRGLLEGRGRADDALCLWFRHN